MNVAIQYELQNQYQTHQRLSLNIRPNISRYDANTDGRYEENDVGGISERSTFADFFAFFAIFLAAFFSVFAAIFASFFGLTINPSASIPVNLSLGTRRILRPRNVFQNLPRDHRQLGDVHRDQECLVAGE
jgi:hypothetical protein